MNSFDGCSLFYFNVLSTLLNFEMPVMRNTASYFSCFFANSLLITVNERNSLSSTKIYYRNLLCSVFVSTTKTRERSKFPRIAIKISTILPIIVFGNMSPYPTVVIVMIAHHTVFWKLLNVMVSFTKSVGLSQIRSMIEKIIIAIIKEVMMNYSGFS
jgi:hypothetical protein